MMQSLEAWELFVLQHGWRAPAPHLAHVVGQDVAAVLKLRATGACTRLTEPKGFAELFALWHGRPPLEGEWPIPRKLGQRAEYEWLAPELSLLATLVGQFGVIEIAQMLTARLRLVTGDKKAKRTRPSILVKMNRIGMEARDVVGGITTTAAGKEIGSITVVHQAIAKKQLTARKVGRLWVIPHAAWATWKESRTFPPEGYVLLTSLKEPLAIRSDKLSEYARMGYVPTAVRCNPYGMGKGTQFGTWYISPAAAKQLVADRRAGRQMPWHGRPMMDNLKATFKTWQKRQHPGSCEVCRQIWGKEGAPKTFEAYVQRYPALAHGAKRHLTRPWTPGMTVDETAAHTRRPRAEVLKAMANGALSYSMLNGRKFITKTDATRWVARKCPDGTASKSWISLETACKLYLFTMRELRALVASNKLTHKIGTDGTMRGQEYVLKHQCGQLREKTGFSEKQAAARLGITVPRLRTLLEGVDWRGAAGIPLVTVQAVRKRLESCEGWDFEEAAADLAVPVAWVKEQVKLGVAKVTKAKWDRRRLYLSAPMMGRLRQALKAPDPAIKPAAGALGLGEAALDAGVSIATMARWGNEGQVERVRGSRGFQYPRGAVRARARRYWRTVRFHRAMPPAWLQAEHAAGGPRRGRTPHQPRLTEKPKR